ncbi:MAG: hypothetical protein ACT4QE_05430 [Anaerolineales bacterium]
MNSSPLPLSPEHEAELYAFVGRLERRVHHYLQARADSAEQVDHLRHVSDRARWLYLSELQRVDPGALPTLSRHESNLIEACALSHDIGKWIPRDDLRELIPQPVAEILPTLREMRLVPNQMDLLLLGIERRFHLAKDGYSPEYDAAHHLVSAYILAADREFHFHHLSLHDQDWLIKAIVGHQFGGYYKDRLLQLSLKDKAITTGMLIDVSRPEALEGDTLACAFHDADLADLLFVGSLQRDAQSGTALHAGGLIKILLINFNLLVHDAPGAPGTFAAVLRSCTTTVNSVCQELLTPTAVQSGYRWRERAAEFLQQLQQPEIDVRIDQLLHDGNRPPTERLAELRQLIGEQAQTFLNRRDGSTD